jgi:hypothetical protein
VWICASEVLDGESGVKPPHSQGRSRELRGSVEICAKANEAPGPFLGQAEL